MKQEQLIAYSLILFIVIPLLISTLGGILILKGFVGFFPYAKFMYGLTVSLGLLLFILKNFHVLYGLIYIFVISLFHTFTLHKSFFFPDINPILSFLLILLFFAGLLLCIRFIFLNKNLRSIRTLVFSLAGAFVFTAVFTLLLKLARHPIYSYKELGNDFSIGFMLFATIGIGFLITDMVLNAFADRFHLKPDFLTVLPPDENDSDEPGSQKDEND